MSVSFASLLHASVTPAAIHVLCPVPLLPFIPPSFFHSRPGALQLRGENLIALLDGLAASKQLRTREQRQQLRLGSSSARQPSPSRINGSSEERRRDAWTGGRVESSARDEMPVYFDFLGLGMVGGCSGCCSTRLFFLVLSLNSLWSET